MYGTAVACGLGSVGLWKCGCPKVLGVCCCECKSMWGCGCEGVIGRYAGTMELRT